MPESPSLMSQNAQILDGKALAQQRGAALSQTITARLAKGHPPPTIATILVGEHAPSKMYIKSKRAACKRVGINAQAHELPENTTQAELLALIEMLNQDTQVNGILVQLPLSTRIDLEAVVSAIDPNKDVDGFNPINMGRLVRNTPGLRPCTPLGVMHLLTHHQIVLRGKKAVVVGASNLVGRPMALELLAAGATVTVCHSLTENLANEVRTADILAVATGVPKLIQGDWVKPGAVVVDIGITRLHSGELSGDVDFDAAAKRASHISPVPGGVGPMTISTILENTLLAQTLQQAS